MSEPDDAVDEVEEVAVGGETQTRVIIYTSDYTIRGNISLFSGARLTDFMNIGTDFVAITRAHVAAPDGQTLLRSTFLNVRREHIVFIVEESALLTD